MLITDVKFPQSPLSKYLPYQPSTLPGQSTQFLMTPKAKWIVGPETWDKMTPVLESPEPLSMTFLSPLFQESLKEHHSDLAEGAELVGLLVTTVGCYQKLRAGTQVTFVRKGFCAVDVLLGVLELLSSLPKIQRFAQSLTIVHTIWSKGGEIYDRTFPGGSKKGRAIVAALGSQPPFIQRVPLQKGKGAAG